MVGALPGFTSLEAPHLTVIGDELWITDPEASTVRRVDAATGEALGEPIALSGPETSRLDKAIGILEEQALCYPTDPFVLSVPTFDGEVVRIGAR